MKIRHLLAVLAVACLARPGALRAQESGIPVGDRARPAMLQTLDGRPVDLAQLVGNGPAVVEFWATWCENCEQLLPTLQKSYATYGSRVKFIGVSVSVNQSLRRVQLHVARYKVPGLQLYDVKGTASGAWDVPATSYVVVIGRNGKVVYTGVGGTQNLDAAIRKAL
jgi:thiol-disulfide isomerase/thioredoxin